MFVCGVVVVVVDGPDAVVRWLQPMYIDVYLCLRV